MKSFIRVTAAASVLATLTACDTSNSPTINPQGTWLSESEKAFLNIQRPYPNYDSVCVLLGDSPNTASLKSPGQELIACPKHEQGATQDRSRNGARTVGQSEYWVILSLSSDLVQQQLQTYQ